MSGEVKPLQGSKSPFFSPTPSDLEWARGGIGFVLGRGTWRERVTAIVRMHGTVPKAAAALDVPTDTVKTWLKRDTKAPRGLDRIAELTGMSVEYLATGRPRVASDFDLELERLAVAKSGFGTSTSPVRREAIQVALQEFRDEIERARSSVGFASASLGSEIASGLSDEPDSLFAPPRLSITLGLPGLADGDAAPFGFSRDWLARQRLDPSDLGMLDLQSSWQLVDLGQTARQLVDGCTYAVHDSGAGCFVLCRWRREDRALVLSDGRAFELERHLLPEAVVGRVVYAITPV